MATNKFKGSFDNIDEAPPAQDRNETRGPGRPIGKRSNPAFRQYTALLRQDTTAPLRNYARPPQSRTSGNWSNNLFRNGLRNRNFGIPTLQHFGIVKL